MGRAVSLPRVLDRPRQTPLIAAVACLLLFAALAVGVSAEWAWLADVDATGRDVPGWADDRSGLHDVLRVIEVAFEGVPRSRSTRWCWPRSCMSSDHRRASMLILAVRSPPSP